MGETVFMLKQPTGASESCWRYGVSTHQLHDCLLNRLFRRRSKKTSTLRFTGLCVRNSLGTGEFPAQMASNAETVSMSWRHYETNCDRQYPHCGFLFGSLLSCARHVCFWANYHYRAHSEELQQYYAVTPHNTSMHSLVKLWTDGFRIL